MAWFDANRLSWPDDGDINAWADFVESLCIFSEDNTIALEEFLDYLTDDKTKSISDILRALNFNESYLSFPESLGIIPPITFSETAVLNDTTEEGETYIEDDIDGEEQEKLRSRGLALFDFLLARKSYFGDFYPFEFIVNRISYINIDSENSYHKLYRILLFASEMKFYAPADINRMGHLFELLCKKPFYQLLPALAEKKFFGAGGGSIITSDYSGSLKERIEQLATDLHILPNPIINDPDELGPSGDAGLDWVGWMLFEDTCDHQPVYFGQCACGSNWVDKQHETSLARWQNFLILNQSVQCFHFMPRSFRRNSLNWFRASKIVHELTLIDRYRLMQLFRMEEQETIVEVLTPFSSLLEESYTFKFAS